MGAWMDGGNAWEGLKEGWRDGVRVEGLSEGRDGVVGRDVGRE